MRGNRQKNHVAARYVIVIDKRQGYIYYYALDKFGVLIYENGQPKLEYVVPYLVQAEQNAENTENNDNTESVENTENTEEGQEVELKAPMVQENEENNEDADAASLAEFQFYDEYNYENPFDVEYSWANYDFAF